MLCVFSSNLFFEHKSEFSFIVISSIFPHNNAAAVYKIPTKWCPASLHVFLQALPCLQIPTFVSDIN